MTDFTFTGPRGQFVTWRHGRAWTRGLTPLEGNALWEASLEPHPVLPTGPFLGGDGLRDPVSVFLAARTLWPTWARTGTPPTMSVPYADPSTGVVA